MEKTMGLGLPVNSGGESKPILKYDARAGRFFKKDPNVDPVECTNGFSAIFDLANIEVGWIEFMEGGAPSWMVVKIGQPLPPRPSPKHKQGFRMNVKLAKSIGGDARELASTAGCVIGAMDQLYDAYRAAPEAGQGKLPVVAMTGTSMVKSGSGAKTSTNYQPHLIIRQWVDRPTELAVNGAANGHAPQTAQAAPASQVPPPVQHAPASQPAAQGDEF
jgi:hypothetical protein